MVDYVTPFVGVWIEIIEVPAGTTAADVTPFVGVWIEIDQHIRATACSTVTPFVGVWIEIAVFPLNREVKASLPSWECGLKSHYTKGIIRLRQVTPFVGVWIEML